MARPRKRVGFDDVPNWLYSSGRGVDDEDGKRAGAADTAGIKAADELSLQRDDPRELKAFFDKIDATPLLKPAEEAVLGERSAGGDMAARRKLIEHNLRLVKAEAQRVYEKSRRYGLTVRELIDVAVVRLEEDLVSPRARFDYRQGRFSTWAVPRIRGAIQDALQGARTNAREGPDVDSLEAIERRLGNAARPRLRCCFCGSEYQLGPEYQRAPYAARLARCDEWWTWHECAGQIGWLDPGTGDWEPLTGEDELREYERQVGRPAPYWRKRSRSPRR